MPARQLVLILVELLATHLSYISILALDVKFWKSALMLEIAGRLHQVSLLGQGSMYHLILPTMMVLLRQAPQARLY